MNRELDYFTQVFCNSLFKSEFYITFFANYYLYKLLYLIAYLATVFSEQKEEQIWHVFLNTLL